MFTCRFSLWHSFRRNKGWELDCNVSNDFWKVSFHNPVYLSDNISSVLWICRNVIWHILLNFSLNYVCDILEHFYIRRDFQLCVLLLHPIIIIIYVVWEEFILCLSSVKEPSTHKKIEMSGPAVFPAFEPLLSSKTRQTTLSCWSSLVARLSDCTLTASQICSTV